MEIENSSEVLDVSEAPQQQDDGGREADVVVEKESVTKPETPQEPENPPAVAATTEPPALNGLHAEETQEPGEESESSPPPPPPPEVVAEPEPTESSHRAEPEPAPEPMDMETQEVVKEVEEAVAAEVAAVTEEAEMPPEPEPMKEPETVKSEVEPETTKEEAEPVEAAETPKVTEPEPEPPKAPEPVTIKEPETLKAAEPEPETLKEPEPPKAAETVKAAEPEPKPEPETPKPAEPEPETPKAAEPESPKAPEPEIVKEPESAKAPEPETVAETITAAESAKAPESEAVPAEVAPETPKAEAEPQPEEEPPSPAAGSLSFALLDREQTRDSLRASRTLVVLRGLPGSGKSFLARAIADTYKDLCTVVCADDHGVKPETPEACADGYRALDEAVAACCGAGSASNAAALVVVDDTNHTQERLARLGEIGEEQRLLVVFLEPLTEWSRDPARLAAKSRRGLEEAQLDAMRLCLEEVTLPLFFGWFLLSSVQDKVRCTAMDFLKTLDTLEAFKKHAADFTGKAEKEVDLEQYFQAKGTLHCTTKFCDYGKATGAKEYAEKTAVRELYGSVFELSLTALFVTPRTVGARVSLSEEQLQLWPADGEKEAEPTVPAAASLPAGSRAHVTLGCAEGVEPVQTGLDLLELLALQQDGQQGESVAEMELGSLLYFGEGRWLLGLREPMAVPACFSSFYGRKESGAAKKEPEKKKKPKCSIL